MSFTTMLVIRITDSRADLVMTCLERPYSGSESESNQLLKSVEICITS